jgi:cytochrome c peroxidase
VAGLTAPNFSRSAASPSEYRNGLNRNTRRAYAFRQEHLTQQKSSVRVMSHALRRLDRTDPLGQSDYGRVSRNGSPSGRQADYTATPVFTILPCIAIQRRTRPVLRWKFLGFAATGYHLRVPDAEQAQSPPVDYDETGFPDTACVAFRLSQAVYRPLFEEVWGEGSFDIKFPPETEEICETPGGAAVFGQNTPVPENTMPVPLSPTDRTRAINVYDHWAQSVDAYEQSMQVSAFSSKFDAFLHGAYTLTADEMAGFQLFNGKGNCNSCHIDGRGTTLMPTQTDTSSTARVNPLFTCFGSANEGLPLNPRDAFFYETTPDPFGFTPNPYGFGYRDLGLGTFVRSGFGSAPSPKLFWRQFAPTVDGQMQVVTVRNVALTPPQCPTTEAGQTDQSGNPIPYFQKAFFHNGYLKSLKQVVHFYNTRDVYPYPVTSGHCPAGTTERVNCWPMPEVPNNIDMTTGNLGLTDTEENQIVAFLETLNDGYTTPYPNIDTFTGSCMTGGSAATQGNESLIPTPPLPPCADAICGVAPTPGPSPIQ